MMEGNIQIYSTRIEWVQATAEKIVDTIEQAVQMNDRCSVALAGGSTPRDVYRALASNSFKNRIPWSSLHLFWGDERMVPPDHSESNFAMVREVLLSDMPIPEKNIHRIQGELEPAIAAMRYADELYQFFPEKAIQFDLVLLGIGKDGHTASLFPKTEVIHETTEPVAALFVPQLEAWRVTLTLPVINEARQVLFLIAGASKSQIVETIFQLEKPHENWPVSLVHPRNGNLTWMLDADAGKFVEYRLNRL